MEENVMNNSNLRNNPTSEEIELVMNHFKTTSGEEEDNQFIQALIEKHGSYWVDNVLNYVIDKLSI